MKYCEVLNNNYYGIESDEANTKISNSHNLSKQGLEKASKAYDHCHSLLKKYCQSI